MRRAAVAGAWFLIACGGDELRLIVPTLPDDARHGALIVTSNTGETWSTPFGPIEAGLVRLETQQRLTEDDELLFVAITEAEVSALGVDASELSTNFVRRAGPTDAPFTPSFAAQGLYAEGAIGLDPIDAPEITAAWMPDCPDSFSGNPEPLMLTNCTRRPCESKVSVNGCDIEIDLSHCDRGFGVLRGTVDGRGVLDFGSANRLGQCRSAGPLPPASLDIACDGGTVTGACHLQLYGIEPELQVGAIDGLPLIDDPTTTTEYTRGRSNLGYLTGLVSVNNRVVVARSRKWLSEYCGPASAANAAPELVFIDPDRMTVTATASAPFCLRHLTADPMGDGFIGVYRDLAARPARDVLARFDPDGVVTQTMPVEDPLIDIDIHTVAVLAILQDPRKSVPSIFLGLGSSDAFDVDNPEYVLRYDTQTFELEAPPFYTSSSVGRNIVDIIQLDTTSWAFVDGGLDVIQKVSFSGQSQDMTALKVACGQVTLSPTRAFVDAAHGVITFIDADSEERSAYAVVGPDRECQGAPLPNAMLRSGVLLPWPNSPWMLVAGYESASTSSTTVTGFFDPANARFLPETHEIGKGPALDGVTDGQGRVWLTLTDSGELVRLSPR